MLLSLTEVQVYLLSVFRKYWNWVVQVDCLQGWFEEGGLGFYERASGSVGKRHAYSSESIWADLFSGGIEYTHLAVQNHCARSRGPPEINASFFSVPYYLSMIFPIAAVAGAERMDGGVVRVRPVRIIPINHVGVYPIATINMDRGRFSHAETIGWKKNRSEFFRTIEFQSQVVGQFVLII